MPEAIGTGLAGRGCFITLEGGEGAGKTTQLKRLAAYLEACGKQVVMTREPGGTASAEALRELLLSSEHAGAWDSVTELLLFLAARREHVVKVIAPQLAEGKWVVCDRFQDSTTAYQGAARGFGHAYVEGLYRQVIGHWWPDVTLVLDIDPMIGLERARRETAKQRKSQDVADPFEAETMEFHQRLREGFREIIRRCPERCVQVDANGDEQAVHGRLIEALEGRLAL